MVISPIALEAVKKIDAIFARERAITGFSAEHRRDARHEQIKPLVEHLHVWMKDQKSRVSSKTQLGKALHYMLVRWDAFARFLDDGRICLTNNAAERALRDVAIGRKAWLFAGSERGGERAAMIYDLDDDEPILAFTNSGIENLRTCLRDLGRTFNDAES